MSKFGDWTLGAKLMTSAVVCFLLCIPLCGMGFTIESSGTKLQGFEWGCGLLLLAAAGILFIASIFAFIFRSRG